jgi:hypothetical protein
VSINACVADAGPLATRVRAAVTASARRPVGASHY